MWPTRCASIRNSNGVALARWSELISCPVPGAFQAKIERDVPCRHAGQSWQWLADVACRAAAGALGQEDPGNGEHLSPA